MQDARKILIAAMDDQGLNRNKLGAILEEKKICSRQTLYDLLGSKNKPGKSINSDTFLRIFDVLGIAMKPKK